MDDDDQQDDSDLNVPARPHQSGRYGNFPDEEKSDGSADARVNIIRQGTPTSDDDNESDEKAEDEHRPLRRRRRRCRNNKRNKAETSEKTEIDSDDL